MKVLAKNILILKQKNEYTGLIQGIESDENTYGKILGIGTDVTTVKLEQSVMLDWNKSKFTINGKVSVISDATLIEALITHDKKQQYTDDEVWIRAQFDEYFDNLNEFILLSDYYILI